MVWFGSKWFGCHRKTVENPPVQLKLIANFINSTILNEIRFYLRVLSVAHLQASTFPSGS